MMSYASKAQRNGFLLAVVHIVNRDWNELVRLYQRLGFIPEGTDLKPIEQGLEDALPDVLNADVSELNFKNVIGKLGDIMYTYVSRDGLCMKRSGFRVSFLTCGSVFSSGLI
jgi:predicted unusual protein kinase regulating ubiquinone biosynthesis (AarF/ABC1/UbiB family)